MRRKFGDTYLELNVFALKFSFKSEITSIVRQVVINLVKEVVGNFLKYITGKIESLEAEYCEIEK